MSPTHRLRPTLSLFAVAAASLLVASVAPAQALKVKEEKPGLLAKAKVAPEAALATAQGAVPKGTLAAAEIEREDGRLVFVFTFKTEGKRGEDEVLIDALTGKLVKTEHESPEDEAREQSSQRSATAKKKPAPQH
ncbi:MAG: PepSY domain-containing protein [Gemmatimonadaceae bacterium]